MKKLLLFACILFFSAKSFGQTITVSTTNLDNVDGVVWGPSVIKSYTVQGSNLTSDLLVIGLPWIAMNFEASLTASPFVTGVIHLTPVAGTVPPTTIYVRMNTGFVGNVFDQVENTSAGAATVYVNVTGSNLGYEPTVSSTISFGTKTNNSIMVNLNGGNGAERLLLVKESSPVDVQPVDGHLWYVGSTGVYGVGTQVGSGNYVVYRGTANTVMVTGLSQAKTYHFAVYDYNTLYGQLGPGFMYGTEGTENYLLVAGNGNTGSETTLNFGNPLPIIINYLNGTKQGSKHLLNWKVTCISTPSVTMALERSTDSRNFTSVNSITADAVRCGQPFDYTDAAPLPGINYYRLKITDIDGAVSYSNIVALLNATKGFNLVSVTPNPVVNGNISLNVASAQAGKMEIAIFNMQGALVDKQTISLIAGSNSLPVNVGGLSSGTYTIKASMDDQQPAIARFIKQ